VQDDNSIAGLAMFSEDGTTSDFDVTTVGAHGEDCSFGLIGHESAAFPE
jgi:hypothetical protein